MRALHTAATGMMAQELNVQVISNNIANLRTTGYKRQRAQFQDLLYENIRRAGSQTVTGIRRRDDPQVVPRPVAVRGTRGARKGFGSRDGARVIGARGSELGARA